MCVILDISSKRMVPTDMLDLACDINPDGFGLAYVDKGIIQIERSIAKNDPKVISGLLEKHKTHRRFLHLRFSTVGKVTMENNHPFILYSNRRGPQIGMMHNGTLYEYSPSRTETDLSDTYCFNRDFLRPLTERVNAFADTKGILVDPFFTKVVGGEIGTNSVLLFFDRFGRVLRYNESKGKQYDGFWASNEYSFNKNHSRSSYRTHSTSSVSRYRSSEYDSRLPWDDITMDEDTQAQALAWESEIINQRREVIQNGILPASTNMMADFERRASEMKKAHDYIEAKKGK